MKHDFSNKHLGILGLGVEGFASAAYFVKHGAVVTILDQKTEQELDQHTLGQVKKLEVKLVLGRDYLQHLQDYDMLVRSPGIKRTSPELIEAEKKGVIITSQTQLFFDLCPAKIIGVTGTKGKGTTSSLIYEMLKTHGLHDTCLGGNIGLPPFAFLDQLTPESWVVLELSSFQLQDLTASPHIGVVLMITRDHLAPDRNIGPHENFHPDVTDYIAAKRNLLRFQTPEDFAILNRDYLATNESDVYTEGKLFYVSRERDADNGCFLKDDAVWVRKDGTDLSADQTAVRQVNAEKKIIDTKDILLPGKHNLENVCAAIMAATLVGVTRDEMVSVLRSFKGLEHRLELVREVKGVRYYDDSIATTPETAIAAIQAFAVPEILILGGASKKSDFSELGEVISKAKNIRAIIGIGKEWERIKSEIRNPKSEIIMIEGAKDMEMVVQAAAKIAVPGDVVLLSPACSSFDMFDNYKQRGDLFKQEVRAL